MPHAKPASTRRPNKNGTLASFHRSPIYHPVH
jgi:hypothetical protein